MTSQLALLLLLTTPSTPETLDSLGHAPPSMVARLRRECVGLEYTRITTPDSARYLVKVGRIDAQGLWRFKVRAMARRPPDPLPWPYVARIDAVHSGRHLGMVAGSLAGGLIGWKLGSVGIGALAGCGIGGGLGSMAVREEQLYVARPATDARPAHDSGAAGTAAVVPALEAAGPGEAAASTVSEPESKRIRKASAAIHAHHRLRVTFTSMDRIEGHVSRADEAGLHALRPASNFGSIPRVPDPIPWARILQVEKHGGSAGRGALIGGIFLGTMGAITGAAVVAGGGIGGSSTGGGAEIAGGAALGALVGGAVGAIVGAAFGAPIPRWQIVY